MQNIAEMSGNMHTNLEYTIAKTEKHVLTPNWIINGKTWKTERMCIIMKYKNL